MSGTQHAADQQQTHDEHGKNSEGDVAAGDEETGRGRVLETNGREDDTGVVHERVETAKLLEDTKAESGDSWSSEIALSCNQSKLLTGVVLSSERLGVFNDGGEILHLELDKSRVGINLVDLCESVACTFFFVLDEVVSRRLGQEVDTDSLDESRYDSDCKEDSPSVASIERDSENVRDELTTGDGNRLNRDESASESSRSDLGNVDRSYSTGDTDTETKDNSTDKYLHEARRGMSEHPFGLEG